MKHKKSKKQFKPGQVLSYKNKYCKDGSYPFVDVVKKYMWYIKKNTWIIWMESGYTVGESFFREYKKPKE